MNIEPTQQQAYLGEVTQHVTTSTPLMRFVPAAAAVSDETVDQWVEQELQRGRSRVRAGVAVLAVLAVVAIPLVFLVR
ncbi:MAG TPA: hypothetical protein VJV39_26165 [Dongiaceae bacterium]|nr:hypothetical protein [Dongiaceae bacterium]